MDVNPTRAQLRAIYTRLSDDDRESMSHAHQQAAAAQYALTHGYVISAIYRDWSSGFDPSRPALQQLIDDAKAGKHGGVIFCRRQPSFVRILSKYPWVGRERREASVPPCSYSARRPGALIALAPQTARWGRVVVR
jgi:hypothetical protein